MAERVLYLPSMGFCLLVAFGCDKLFQVLKKMENNSVTVSPIFQRGGVLRFLTLAGLLATLLVHAGNKLFLILILIVILILILILILIFQARQ